MDRFLIPEMDFSRPPVIYKKALYECLKKVFKEEFSYQDMLPSGIRRKGSMEEILKKVPWHFAAGILGSAEYIARTPGLT